MSKQMESKEPNTETNFKEWIDSHTPDEVDRNVIVIIIKTLWEGFGRQNLSDSRKKEMVVRHLENKLAGGTRSKNCTRAEYLVFMEKSIISSELTDHYRKGDANFIDLLIIIRTWIRDKKTEIYKDLEVEKNFKKSLKPPAAAVGEPEFTEIELTAVAHKVVLFHELGIIEPLKKLCRSKNPTLSDTQFADLVGSMMGFRDKQLETVRKALSAYGQGKSGDVKSKAAMNNVKSQLMKFGIDL